MWLFVQTSAAQELDNSRVKWLVFYSDTISIDSLSIVPESFLLSTGADSIAATQYILNPVNATLIWTAHGRPDSVLATYRVFPLYFPKTYANRSRDLIQSEAVFQKNPFKYTPRETTEDPLFMNGLNKTGSISRGIGFGNNQDLTVNSSMNLQLSGKINENLNIVASVTDDNIPIQPEGNTAQIQEFDQVFIKLFNENSALTAGDFILEKPEGYFMNYYKRAQGMNFRTRQTLRHLQVVDGDSLGAVEIRGEASAAMSKGKFARNTFSGMEGNQGPYVLKGNENEAFIIVLAGTEKVYIDGRLMQRGLSNDYVIDYNTAELTFTSNQPITKDKRITVEFQYSDANYARSLFQGSTGISGTKFNTYINLYSEQDAKNNSLQNLDDNDKRILTNAGDSLLEAVAPSWKAVPEFNNDQVLYTLVDTLGYDSVFVLATGSEANFFTVAFSDVGLGNGDYVKQGFSATGRIFKWIAPDTTAEGTIVRKGNYAPLRRLTAPQKKQMAVIGGSYEFSPNTALRFESAVTNSDLNTFSPKHSADDVGYAAVFGAHHIARLQKDVPNPLLLTGDLNIEHHDRNFSPVEPFRSTEFYRDWNLPQIGVKEQQTLAGLSLTLSKAENYQLGYGISTLQTPHYRGTKNTVAAKAHFTGLNMGYDGSLLDASGKFSSRFYRHKGFLEKALWITKIGFTDEMEINKFGEAGADTMSYKFYDWQAYLTNNDSTKINYRIFYRTRTDWGTRLADTDFKPATEAVQYGAEVGLVKNPRHQLKAQVSNRILTIKDDALAEAEPEKTLLARIEHSLMTAGNWLSSNIFYELGSGLERENEFVYLADPTGQGQYTWIDYNGNNLKELNEFELARPEDGDRYIRVFTVTDNFVKVFTNKYSQALNLTPASVWHDKEDLLKFISLFSNQTSFNIERKTSREPDAKRFNPFVTSFNDSSLISQSTSIRNTFFFNRTNSTYGIDYTYSNQFAKMPLTGGFQQRTDETHQLRGRWNITSQFSIVSENETGLRTRSSDVLSGSDFKIAYIRVKQTASFQPGTQFRVSLTNTYTVKDNAEQFGGQNAKLTDIGIDFRLNSIERGSIFTSFNTILIAYTGEDFNSVRYEMLDGLNPGRNFTWAAGVQRTLGENIQLTLSYNGRKSEEVKSIHTGNVQVRAFF